MLDDGRVPGVRSIIADRDNSFWLSNTLHRYKVGPDSAAQDEEAPDEKLGGRGDAIPLLHVVCDR